MSKPISGEISIFWKPSWLRFARTWKGHDFLKSLNMSFSLSWEFLVEWAWHWGWTLFKWWNLVLICWTPWAACDAVTIPCAILLAPIPWTTPFVAQLQILALCRLQHCFQCCFHLPNMGEEACWGHYASNKWSVRGMLNNCLNVFSNVWTQLLFTYNDMQDTYKHYIL